MDYKKSIFIIIIVLIIVFVVDIYHNSNRSTTRNENFQIAILVIGSVLALIEFPNVKKIGGRIFMIEIYLNNKVDVEEFDYESLKEKKHQIILKKDPIEGTLKVYWNGSFQSSKFTKTQGKSISLADTRFTTWAKLVEPSVGASTPKDNEVVIRIEYLSK